MRGHYNKTHFLSLIFILALVFLLVAAFQGPHSIRIVEFVDEGLERAVRTAIDKPEGPIYTDDVETIQVLDASNHKIRRLDGIEALFELVELNLDSNYVKSVSPLKNLMKLQKLNLRNNEIIDLEAVDFQDIIHLYIRNLNLRHNVIWDAQGNDTRLSDITLVGQMAQMRKLKLRENHIEDLTPLSNLRRLTELDLRENRFTTIAPLETLTRLRELNLRENAITSLEPIRHLSRLIYLNIHSDVDIESFEPITGLVNLETLIMRNVPIEDPQFLKKLTKLQRFNAIDTGLEHLQDKSVIESLLSKGALKGQVRPLKILHTLEAPLLSRASGFYKEGFALTLSASNTGDPIYYTLDGSEPSKTSPRYTQAVEIDAIDQNAATVVRAKVIASDNRMSETVTGTFFVHENIDERFTFPIFSIVTDPGNLFDEAIGIYTEENAFERGSDWERPIHLEYFEADGTLELKQNLGVRINGGHSRRHAQKSLRLYADLEYSDEAYMDCDFFKGLPKNNGAGELCRFKTLILRNAGNDWSVAMLRDAFMQNLVAPLNTVDTQAYRPSVVFINGEYYGLYNLRERYDEFYFAENYDIDEDDITILEQNAILFRGTPEGKYHYDKMTREVESRGIQDDASREYFETLIDYDNFIDYFASQIYFGNLDWPRNNIMYWRKTTDGYVEDAPYGQDGRWRWVLQDVDQGFGLYSSPLGVKEEPRDVTCNSVSWMMDELDGMFGTQTWPNLLFRQSMLNEQLNIRFLNRMNDLLNSHFSDRAVQTMVEAMRGDMENEMAWHIDRWKAIESVETWLENIDALIEYGRDRPFYIRKYLMETFDIEGTAVVKIANETKRGHVRVNTIDIDGDLPGNDIHHVWTGTYFKGIPMTVEAVSEDGFVFSHWEGIDASDKRVEIVPEGDLSIRAVFIPID
jgi:hypothetical protein